MLPELIKKVVGTLVILVFASTILAIPTDNGNKVFASTAPENTSTYSYDYCLDSAPEITSSVFEIVTEIGTSLNINDPSTMKLAAFDCYGNNITSKIKVKNTGGFDANVLGSYNIIYTVTDANGNTSYPFTHYVSVEHNAGPVISGAKSKEIIIGADVNIYDPSTMGLKVTDKYDGNITSDDLIYIDGSYNLYALGTYKIKYVAYDSAYNKSTPYEFTIKVVDTKTTAHYYSNGKIKDKTVSHYYSTNLSAGILKDKTIAHYYSNGKIKDKTVYTYDKYGYLLNKVITKYNSKGVTTSYHKYSYDILGDLTQEIICSYHSNGNVKNKKVITYDYNGKKDYYTLNKYDSNKKLLSKSKVYY